MNNNNSTEKDEISIENTNKGFNEKKYADFKDNERKECEINKNPFFSKIGFTVLDYFEGPKNIHDRHQNK